MYPSLGYASNPYYYTNGAGVAQIPPVVGTLSAQQQPPIINLIPTAQNEQQQHHIPENVPLHQVEPQQQVPTTNNSPTCARGNNHCCNFWKRCREQHKFLHALQSKTLSCIPRAVVVGGVLLFILTLIFLFTVGSSIDGKMAYKKDQCLIMKDPDNLVVHFDYDRDMYYINLNVDLASGTKYYMGCDSCVAKPPSSSTSAVKKMYTLREVCASPLLQKTSDCRDRIIAKGSLTCMVNRRLRKRSGMDHYYHGHGGENKAPGNHHKEDNAGPQMMHHGHHHHPGMMTRELHHSGPRHGPHIMTREIPLSQILSKQEPNHDQSNEQAHDVHRSDHYGRQFNSEMVKTVQEVKRSFRKHLHRTVPIWLIISLIAMVVFIVVGYKRLEGRSKCSIDRFFKQYLKNPFKESGQVYKLDEVSQSCVIIQEPKEPKDHTLLSSATLQMELPPRKERALAKRMKMFYGALRHTATEPHETLLYYEKVSKKNLCSHFHGNNSQSSCNGKRRIAKAIKILLGVLFVLAVGTLIAFAVISFCNKSVIRGLIFLHLSIAAIGVVISKILFRMRKVHYYITDKRVIRVDELPCRLRLTLRYVSFDKIHSVWADGNKIHLKLLPHEKTGIFFEHAVDPAFVVNLIQQRIPSSESTNNSGDVELQEQPTTEPTATQN
ncbi:hypothetical protein C9374_013089 [Naegleria lovaniensis]|uniref:Uncharacterized protein n=1 Tax=Naegleria lovaniensis TaxID=51637 RepID=A0AA88GC16_NAELO|nr:uncharacterized protein C9374_013089 [Naegleria lovaniensis]KAG2372882.1 hypothetical protein C9374_013089 [Naegleria lovaniensis]